MRPSSRLVIQSKDGLEIYAEASGNPSKPHVVFIHGLGLSSIAWDAQFSDPWLMDRIYAVRYDMRGHGRSGKPIDLEAWSSERFAEDFDAVATTFNLRKPFLAGWSYGCTPAVDIVNAFGPKYLSGLIYIGGLPFTTAKAVVTPWQRTTLQRLQKHTDLEGLREGLRDYIKQMVVDPKSMPGDIQEEWVKTMLLQPIPIMQRVLRREQDIDRFWKEGASGLPLLVIHGKQDRICDHDALVSEACTRFSDITIESWSGVGHVPQLERTVAFDKVVASWVEHVSALEFLRDKIPYSGSY